MSLALFVVFSLMTIASAVSERTRNTPLPDIIAMVATSMVTFVWIIRSDRVSFFYRSAARFLSSAFSAVQAHAAFNIVSACLQVGNPNGQPVSDDLKW